MNKNLAEQAIFTANALRNLSKTIRDETEEIRFTLSPLKERTKTWRFALESHAADLERAAETEVSK
jgi:hypothetical protein